MDKCYYFDRNMIALSTSNPSLCTRLSSAETTLNRYKFIDSKTSYKIPAWIDKSGAAHTLHSFINPEKEAAKLISTLKDEGYIVILGLGGAFLAQEALKKESVQKVVVIDYDINGLAELLCSKEYILLFGDPRFTLLQDPSPCEIESYITATYFPCIHNGIRVIPLRPRCDFDNESFAPASAAIRSAIDSVSVDYSVQAYFGKRWFSNIIRNILAAENQFGVIAPISKAIICAAGPSLDGELYLLEKKQKDFFIIATDTALGTLLKCGIRVDAVISIDCQHISYFHFLGNSVDKTPVFLDLASPPLLFSRTGRPVFFSGGHPLTNYASSFFKNFIQLDTSGANVTYAGVSLAEKLGAKNIEIYGADFSYPQGNAYTKGAYFYPYLNMKQNRLKPTSSALFEFLFKNKTLKRITNGDSYYYETRSLEMYRRKLEEKIYSSKIIPVEGLGAPINLKYQQKEEQANNTIKLFSSGKTFVGAKEFLSDYREKIESLPKLKDAFDVYLKKLSELEKTIFSTIMPTAAAIKRSEPNLNNEELFKKVQSYCADKIEAVLSGIENSRSS